MAAKTKNIELVTNELIKAGIANKFAIAAVLAVISKESGFIPQTELSYSKTSNSRIREIFSKTSSLTDQQLNALKANPENFFNYVYGGKYGNSPNEGYKFRGRGFNQLTFKDNYSAYGKLLGLDLINNPDLVNDPQIAAKITAAYFKKRFQDSKDIVLKRYGAKNINDFNDTTTAVNAFYNANAGFGKDTSKTLTEGKKTALSKVKSIYDIVSNAVTDNPGKTGGLLLLGLGLFAASKLS
jgi:putative chitinase